MEEIKFLIDSDLKNKFYDLHRKLVKQNNRHVTFAEALSYLIEKEDKCE